MRITEVIIPLIVFSIISFIISKTLYTYTKDVKWMYFNYALFACIFVIFMLLKLNLYVWFIIGTLITMLGIILFLMYKIDVKTFFSTNFESSSRLFNNLKDNLINSSLFFWILLVISFITFLGIIMAYKIKNKMQEKEGVPGDRGYIGSRGEKGAISEISNSNYEIIYIQLLDHAEIHLQKYKETRNPPINYKEGAKHLKNFQFKEHLKRISYSGELRRDIYNANKTNNPSGECNNENKILLNTIDNLKIELEYLLDNILLYKNGLRFLSDTFGMASDWDYLYTNADKLAGLEERNPYRRLANKSVKWNYGGTCK